MNKIFFVIICFTSFSISSCYDRGLSDEEKAPYFKRMSFKRRTSPILDEEYPIVSLFKTPSYEGLSINIIGPEKLKKEIYGKFIFLNKEGKELPYLQNTGVSAVFGVPENTMIITPDAGHLYWFLLESVEVVSKINIETNHGKIYNIYRTGDIIESNYFDDADVLFIIGTRKFTPYLRT